MVVASATGTRRAGTVHRLDDPFQHEAIMGDVSRLTRGARPILIDEWQRIPESWDVVRRAVDDDSTVGQFILQAATDNPPKLRYICPAARAIVAQAGAERL